MKQKVIQNELFFAEVAELVAAGSRVKMRARGNSMLPLIRHGKDNVTLQSVNEDSFRKGSLLLVRMPGGSYILHRLMKCMGDELLLRGDGNLSLIETCNRNDVIAEVVEVERGNKIIVKGSLRWNMYHRLWPRNPLMRRVALAVYRRVPLLRR
mgnify:CR=1 FL=1